MLLLLKTEVWPLSNRAYGISLGASANWMTNFIVGQITPIMLQRITYGTFIFFGLMTTGGWIFIYFGVPETKRLTLEEMDVLFGSRGVAEGEKERMRGINREIGLEAVLEGIGMGKGEGDAGSSDGEEKKGMGMGMGRKAEEIEKVL